MRARRHRASLHISRLARQSDDRSSTASVSASAAGPILAGQDRRPDFLWGPAIDDSSRHDGRRGSITDRRGGGRDSRQTDLPSQPRSVSRSWGRPFFQHQRSNNTRPCYSTYPLRVASATVAQRILARLEQHMIDPPALQSRHEESSSRLGRRRILWAAGAGAFSLNNPCRSTVG